MRLAIVLVLLCGSAAHADTNNDELSTGGTVRALHAPSANAVTGDSLGGPMFGYARDLGLSTVPGLAVWADTQLAVGSAKGTLFQTMSTELSTESILVGVRARYALHRLIAATARLDLGAQHANLDLANASDDGWGAVTSVAVGLDLFAIDRAPFGFGVRLEYGYVLAQGIALAPRAERSGDTSMLPTQVFSLGKLDLTGKMFALAFVGQF